MSTPMPEGQSSEPALTPENENVLQRWTEAPTIAAKNGMSYAWLVFSDWYASGAPDSAALAVASTFQNPAEALPGLCFLPQERPVIQQVFGQVNGSVQPPEQEQSQP